MSSAASADAAASAVVRPATTCGYTFAALENDSTAISVQVVPQCAGEAAASPIMWEYVPISHGDTFVHYVVTTSPGNVVTLTYTCPGSAPNIYQVIYTSAGSVITQNISDDCGTFTQP